MHQCYWRLLAVFRKISISISKIKIATCDFMPMSFETKSKTTQLGYIIQICYTNRPFGIHRKLVGFIMPEEIQCCTSQRSEVSVSSQRVLFSVKQTEEAAQSMLDLVTVDSVCKTPTRVAAPAESVSTGNLVSSEETSAYAS